MFELLLILGIVMFFITLINLDNTGTFSGFYSPYIRPSDGKVFEWKYSQCGEIKHCKYKLKSLILKKLGFEFYNSIPSTSQSHYSFRQLCRNLDTLMKDLELDDCINYPSEFKSDAIIDDADKNANINYISNTGNANKNAKIGSINEQIYKGCDVVDEVIVSLDLIECFPGVYDTRNTPRITKSRKYKRRYS